MEVVAQIVLPLEVIFVILLGAYICRGRETEDNGTPEKLSAKGSSGKLY
jgi:hypothetical protein